MKNEKLNTVLTLNPLEFDNHFFFPSWKPTTYDFYSKFHIERVEIYKNHLTLPIQPHKRSVYIFFFLKTGKAVRTRGLTKYEIHANECFFLSAQQITTIEYISDDATGYYCHFYEDIFLQNSIKVNINIDFPFFQSWNNPIIHVANHERITQLCEILIDEYKFSVPERLKLVVLYLLMVLNELKSNNYYNQATPIDASTAITQKYKSVLAEYIYEKKTVTEFADLLAISPNHLHKCVKLTTGKSAHELLNDMRILEAKVLLKQTNMTIGEIAFKIGQFETSDFSRLFKKSTKLTPNQYRSS